MLTIRRLNWTKVGLKVFFEKGLCLLEDRLNWTKVGLKDGLEPDSYSDPGKFELD